VAYSLEPGAWAEEVLPHIQTTLAQGSFVCLSLWREGSRQRNGEGEVREGPKAAEGTDRTAS